MPTNHRQTRPFIADSDILLFHLPLEIIHQIILHLPLTAVIRFRQVNRAARSAVNSSLPYQNITLHCPKVLTAILETNMGPRTTISQIYDVLCTSKCSICHSSDDTFGTFFYILDCRRACFNCIWKCPQSFPPNVSVYSSYYDIIPEIVASKVLDARDVVIRRDGGLTAYYSLIEIDELEELLQENVYSSKEEAEHIRRWFSDTMVLWVTLTKDQYLGQWDGLREIQFPSERAIVHMPWLNISKKRVDNGISCLYCYQGNSRCSDRDSHDYHKFSCFTEEGHRRHAETCESRKDAETTAGKMRRLSEAELIWF